MRDTLYVDMLRKLLVVVSMNASKTRDKIVLMFVLVSVPAYHIAMKM